jgi:flagellar motor switch protein FliN
MHQPSRLDAKAQVIAGFFRDAVTEVHAPATCRAMALEDVDAVTWTGFVLTGIDLQFWVGSADAESRPDAVAERFAAVIAESCTARIGLEPAEGGTPSADVAIAAERQEGGSLLLGFEPGFVAALYALIRRDAGGPTRGGLLDLHLHVSVSVGNASVALGEALTFGNGAVIELNTPADALVDVVVNRCTVARGELVIVDGNYGVRIREVAGLPAGRLGAGAGGEK